jgi:micrococcal nuclease
VKCIIGVLFFTVSFLKGVPIKINSDLKTLNLNATIHHLSIMIRSILFSALVIFTACNLNEISVQQNDIAEENYVFYTVKKVSDGDTFWIENGTEKGEKVRMTGIDTPESHKSERKDVQYFGNEAEEYSRKLLLGKKVRLEYDVTPKDKYGRTLAYVYLEDGTFVNAHLIENGYAKAFTFPPNVRYADEFVQLEQQARAQNEGLWAR